MTTAYVAAEKFIQWSENGQLVIDESLADAISSHRKNHRFVIYFAPARFGLWLEDRREVEEAWHYLESSLKATGMPVQEVMLFDHDVDVVRFQQDMQDHPEEAEVMGKRARLLAEQCYNINSTAKMLDEVLQSF